LKNETNEKVIKPPVKKITSGKLFKPSKAYLQKILLQPIVALIIFWGLTIIGLAVFSVAAPYMEDPGYSYMAEAFTIWIGPVSFWTIIINIIWFIPIMIYQPFYYRSIEFSVKAESGETMPEIYVKQGVLTVTRKHVPFRTITNISTRAGPFDRLFKIGSVHVETAGYSGSNQQGPEVKLVGIVFYEEVRDFILNELRKFKTPYVIGTEVTYPNEKPVPRTEGLDDEILIALRQIRDLIKNQKN
jgi:membrane protein YdbS with pleckstrin-like domain